MVYKNSLCRGELAQLVSALTLEPLEHTNHTNGVGSNPTRVTKLRSRQTRPLCLLQTVQIEVGIISATWFGKSCIKRWSRVPEEQYLDTLKWSQTCRKE